MAYVQAGEIIYHLDREFKKALHRTLEKHFPGQQYEVSLIYKDLQRDVDRACSQWEHVPDDCVRD